MFSFITLNWRGRPLTSIRTIVELIAATTTKTGLTIQADHDPTEYPKGVKVSDAELAAIPLTRHDWQRRLELHHPPHMKRQIKFTASPYRASGTLPKAFTDRNCAGRRNSAVGP